MSRFQFLSNVHFTLVKQVTCIILSSTLSTNTEFKDKLINLLPFSIIGQTCLA